MAPLRVFLHVSLLLVTQVAFANLLSEPNLRWKFTLEGASKGLFGRNLRKGNAVVADPKDGSTLFVTADDGSFHIVKGGDGNETQPTSTVFEPESIAGRYTECRSGVTIVEEQKNTTGETTTTYLVYAVVDTPVASNVRYDDNGDIQGDVAIVSSRVMAVNLDGSLRWSVNVAGIVVGTPVASGTAIYLSHNVEGKGYLSVILTTTEDAPELTASLAPEDRDGPFGPPSAVVLSSQNAAAANDNNNQNAKDVVAVAESWGDGYTEDGSIYILVPSAEFEDWGGRGNESYELRLVSDWPFSAVARPLLSGTSLYMGGTGSQIAGWAGNRDISGVLEGRDTNADPRWSVQLEPSERNASQREFKYIVQNYWMQPIPLMAYS
jgi:hypothetical protein